MPAFPHGYEMDVPKDALPPLLFDYMERKAAHYGLSLDNYMRWLAFDNFGEPEDISGKPDEVKLWFLEVSVAIGFIDQTNPFPEPPPSLAARFGSFG